MTEQEIFDTVVAHARKQGRKCVDESGDCLYRHGPDKCFAGALIPDNVYSTGMEQLMIMPLLNANTISDIRVPSMENTDGTLTDKNLQDLRELGLAEHASLVVKLQKIHGDYEPNRWERQFEDIAQTYGLTYSAPGALA